MTDPQTIKARNRLEKVLRASRERMQEEVSALIGISFKMGEPEFRLLGKEALFEGLDGKRVLAHIKVDGEVEGKGCLLVGVKDAINIGGRLIMLPDSELKSVIAEEDYSDELQDSFGEVANIICGSATYTLEEQFPKKVRLIRTEQEVVIPVKVETDSEQPIANGDYLIMSLPLEVDNQPLGALDMVLPAEPFGLVDGAATQAAVDQVQATAQQAGADSAAAAGEQAAAEHNGEDGVQGAAPAGPQATGEQAAAGAMASRPGAEAPDVEPSRPKRDASKQKKIVDSLLKASMERVSDEVSGLLGGGLQVLPLDNIALSKADFLEQAGGKQVMARLDIRGGKQGEAYLFVDHKTAIHLGGTLIMLPESELEEAIRNEEFGDDTSDAYGEIANIIAGVYTAVFEEQYPAKLGFTKTEMETVVPVKVDPDSDEIFANQGYYLSTGQLQYNGKELARLQVLVPLEAFDLEDLLQAKDERVVAAGSEADGARDEAAAGSGGSAAAAEAGGQVRTQAPEQADILIFSDDEAESERLNAALQELGYTARLAHFKEPVASVLGSRIQLVFLVMGEVSEQGFGVAIKLGSAGLNVPLVAAGPAWTRSMVLKAVKYGASDILVTPSIPGDIRQKLETNLIRRAA